MQTVDVGEPTDGQDTVALTDWVEVSILVLKQERLSRAAIRKNIAGLLGSEDTDLAVDAVLSEVRRREAICGAIYPFSQENGGIRFVRSDASVPYLFMLSISTSRPYRIEHRQKDTDELFDSLVSDGLEVYTGGTALQFGSPPRHGRPAKFTDALLWLATKLGLERGRGAARMHTGDGGLDVVAWRAFGDDRSGFLVMLAQCTVQIDWFGKAKDLAEDVWRGWIDFGKDPHLALAVPFVIPTSYEKWSELRCTVHSVLDRLRLCALLRSGKVTQRIAMAKWTASEVVRMSGN